LGNFLAQISELTTLPNTQLLLPNIIIDIACSVCMIGTGTLFWKFTILKVHYSADPLFGLGLGLW